MFSSVLVGNCKYLFLFYEMAIDEVIKQLKMGRELSTLTVPEPCMPTAPIPPLSAVSLENVVCLHTRCTSAHTLHLCACCNQSSTSVQNSICGKEHVNRDSYTVLQFRSPVLSFCIPTVL